MSNEKTSLPRWPPGSTTTTMSKAAKSWESYEQVAQHLLNEFAVHFGLGKVEGKQIVPAESGTTWEIDAKGVKVGEEGFIIVECRRRMGSGLPQESIAALAFRIQDTKAAGAIVVTPLDLQAGAQKVAAYANIVHVKLDPKSTTAEYVMSFLDKVFIGVADPILLKEQVTIEIKREARGQTQT
jgi:hypothetical protein